MIVNSLPRCCAEIWTHHSYSARYPERMELIDCDVLAALQHPLVCGKRLHEHTIFCFGLPEFNLDVLFAPGTPQWEDAAPKVDVGVLSDCGGHERLPECVEECGVGDRWGNSEAGADSQRGRILRLYFDLR